MEGMESFQQTLGLEDMAKMCKIVKAETKVIGNCIHLSECPRPEVLLTVSSEVCSDTAFRGQMSSRWMAKWAFSNYLSKTLSRLWRINRVNKAVNKQRTSIWPDFYQYLPVFSPFSAMWLWFPVYTGPEGERVTTKPIAMGACNLSHFWSWRQPHNCRQITPAACWAATHDQVLAVGSGLVRIWSHSVNPNKGENVIQLQVKKKEYGKLILCNFCSFLFDIWWQASLESIWGTYVQSLLRETSALSSAIIYIPKAAYLVLTGESPVVQAELLQLTFFQQTDTLSASSGALNMRCLNLSVIISPLPTMVERICRGLPMSWWKASENLVSSWFSRYKRRMEGPMGW